MNRPASAIAAIALVTTLASAGCHDLLETGLTGAVITLVDSGPPLRDARTFALPDTIIELESSVINLDHANDATLTARIRNHLLMLGWIDVTFDTAAPRPDVLLLTVATTRIQTGVMYSDWYGSWGYLPYWSPAVSSSWGWGAPTGAVPYSFPAGTLLVTMLDLRAQEETTQQIPLLWAAAIDGVASASSATTERALEGLDQAFTQSPYLTRIP